MFVDRFVGAAAGAMGAAPRGATLCVGGERCTGAGGAADRAGAPLGGEAARPGAGGATFLAGGAALCRTRGYERGGRDISACVGVK